MGIITKGMGAILKSAKKRKTLTLSFSKSKPKFPPRKGEVIIKKKSKPSTTKLADTWQDRRIDAINRKIKKTRGQSAVEDYAQFHSLTPDQKSEVYMKKAKRDPKSFHFDKKKFGKK